MNANIPNIGCEVMMIAYNGRSVRKSRTEALITGTVVKTTKDYIHIRSYEDNKVWKSPVYLLGANIGF